MKVLPLMIFALLAGCDRIPGTTASLESEARATLASGLFDAETARFSDLWEKEMTGEGKPERIICGKVNAKNRLGAYGGFTRFAVSPGSGAAIVDPKVEATEADFDAAVDRCRAAKRDPFSAEIAGSICKQVTEFTDLRAHQAGFEEVWKSCAKAKDKTALN